MTTPQTPGAVPGTQRPGSTEGEAVGPANGGAPCEGVTYVSASDFGGLGLEFTASCNSIPGCGFNLDLTKVDGIGFALPGQHIHTAHLRHIAEVRP